jgi:hypothetical protein
MPTDRDNAEERLARVDLLIQKLRTRSDRDRPASKRAQQAKAQISAKPKKKVR